MAGARCSPSRMLWYSVCTLIMAVMPNGFWVDIWRFIAGIGIGVELVTIDTYVSEIIPRYARGRAFAFSQFVTSARCRSWRSSRRPGFRRRTNWRWVVVIGSTGALVVWWLRPSLPESPRWLARHGRVGEAEAVVERDRTQGDGGDRAALQPIGVAIEETGEASF